MRRVTVILLLILTVVSWDASSRADGLKDRNGLLVPDYLRTQYAGNIGLVSAGGGYLALGGSFEVDMLYGLVPRSAGGTEIHSLTLKTTFTPYRTGWLGNYRFTPLRLGLSASVALGETYFVSLPQRYPSNYYWPTALRFGLYAGTGIQRDLDGFLGFRAVDLYFEVGTVDIYLRNYLLSDYIRFWDIVSFGIGTSLYF